MNVHQATKFVDAWKVAGDCFSIESKKGAAWCPTIS